MRSIIECIPNISDGRRQDVVESVVAAVRGSAGVRVLDVQSDRDHNRSVLTIVGDSESLPAAVLALFEAALAGVKPEEPVYPFSRQLRQEAQQALERAGRGGR